MTTARRGRGAAVRRAGVIWALIVVAVLATGCVTVEADSGFVMGGNIIVREGEVARDDVVAVGGNVRIDGRATRDVVVVGGRLVINGEAERNVSCVGGTLVLGPRARVGRDVVVVAGSLERADSARIGGQVVNVSAPFGATQWMAPSWGWWQYNPFAWLFRTTQLFYWLIFALVTVALVGDRVSSTAHAVSREPLRMGAIGLVAVFALFFGFLILLVMSILIIGIPFLIGLIILWCVAYIFGLVAVFQAVGSRLMRLVGRPEASQIAIVLSGGLVLGILHYMPVFGGLLWFVAGLVGLGAVFATRFGTGRPWVRRSAPPPMGGGTAHYAPPAPEPAAPPPASAAGAGPAEFDAPAAEPEEPGSYDQPTGGESGPEPDDEPR